MKAERVQVMLQGCRGWELAKDAQAITKTYELPSFRAGMAFATYVAEVAESADHHPDIRISFKTVTLTLTTHEKNSLTKRDFDLARIIDGLA